MKFIGHKALKGFLKESRNQKKRNEKGRWRMMKFCECCDSKPATHEADWISDGHIVGKVLVCGKCLAVGSVSGNYYEEIRKLKFIFKNPSRKQTPIGMFTTYLVNADKQGSMKKTHNLPPSSRHQEDVWVAIGCMALVAATLILSFVVKVFEDL
jgi:hypothetical protein